MELKESHRKRRLFAMLRSVLAVPLLLASCGQVPRYNSQDLAGLPCEPATVRFFYPLEFTAQGLERFPVQRNEIELAISDVAVTDVFTFVHGWDKTASTAERDYQDFICRLHRQVVRRPLPDQGRIIVIGVFWPATVFANQPDPAVLKPLSYRTIRNRATRIAKNGFGPVLIGMLAKQGAARDVRYHFIGHSFGAKMIWEGLSEYLRVSRQDPWLHRSSVNLVLVLAAMDPQQFEALYEPLKAKTDDEAVILFFRILLGIPRRLQIFALFSTNDVPNTLLFRMAEGQCAVGGCGQPGRPTARVTEETMCAVKEPLELYQPITNIDSTTIIQGHTDIYKGRVAALVWALLRGDAPSSPIRTEP